MAVKSMLDSGDETTDSFPSTALRVRNDKKRERECPDQSAGYWLVEAAAGAVFGVVVAFDLAFAHFFGVAGGFVGAGFFFGGGEDAFFGCG